MSGMLVTKRKYPWSGEIRGRKYTFRPLVPQDRDAIIAFTSGLSHLDILFLQSDITKPEVIDEWIYLVGKGRAFVLLAFNSAEEIVGYASVYRNENSWSRHLAELRLFVHSRWRGTGVGKHLAGEITRVAEEQRPAIITVSVPREHPHVRAILEQKGYIAEALLKDWLMDVDGRMHDMLLMARRLADEVY